MKTKTKSKSILDNPQIRERAVTYARVSKDDRQNATSGLASQTDMCQKHCTEKGYLIIAELAEDDRGASGAEVDLPQLNQIRAMAKNGDFDVLVVRELDRLSRSLAKQLIIEEELKRAGVRIEYVLVEYDNSPEGQFQKNIKATVAEYEREKIKERTVRGRKNKVAAGNVLVAGRPPYGYKLETENGKTVLAIIDREADVIRLIFQWYVIEKLSMRAIAMKLDKLNAPLPHNPIRKNNLGIWFSSTVGNIIKNETHTGVWYFGKGNSRTGKKNPRDEWMAVEVPTIINRGTWEMAQEIAQQNSETAKRNVKYDYLLGRLVTCGVCGCKCNGHAQGRYYGCASQGNREMRSRNCALPLFRVDQVDNAAWEWIKSLLFEPKRLKEGLKEYQKLREEKNAPLHDRLKVIDNLLADNNVQLTKLLDLYLTGKFSKELLMERQDKLESTISALNKERATLIVQLESGHLTENQIADIEEFASNVRAGLESVDSDFAAKRRIIELLDTKATLTIENERKVIYLQCRLGTIMTSITSTTTGGSAAVPAP